MSSVGQVLRVVGADALILVDGKPVSALCPKMLKLQGLCAGDYVEYEFDASLNNNLIGKIVPRKNHIDRPTISNVDNAFVLVSEIPKPDFYVLDKILVNLGIENIAPYIVISKQDIVEDNFIDIVKSQYKNCVKDIIVLSALNGDGLDKFIQLTKSKVSVLIGQSAVGKSSLLNALGLQIKTNSVALKVGKRRERGKNTTKNSQLYLTSYGALIADTPGFKMLDLDNLEPEQLSHYYPEIREYAVKCQYSDCTHLPNNEGCQVITAVQKGKIPVERYDRYIRLKNAIQKKRSFYGK